MTRLYGGVIIEQMNNKYLISEWEQLRFVPTSIVNNITYGLSLCSIRYEDCICKTITIVREPNTIREQNLYTFIVDSIKINQNIKLLNTNTIIDIINSFGFNIEWVNHISLSVKEYDILCSLYKLGYNYIERLKYSTHNNETYLAVTENILSSYDSDFKPKKMQDLCNTKISENDFKWIEPEHYISISAILGLNLRNKDYDGWS